MPDQSALGRARRLWLKAQELRWRAGRPHNVARSASLLRMAEAYEGMARQAEEGAAPRDTARHPRPK
jgi:hypothetical protein